MSTSSVVRIKSASDMALDLIRTDYPDYHPLVSLARLAHRADVTADPKLEFEVHKAILPYVAPKLSSVEVKSENTNTQRVIVSLFEMATLEDGSQVETEVPLVTDVTELVRLD